MKQKAPARTPAAGASRRNGNLAIQSRPVAELHLTAKERATLADSDRVTEDEEDLILAGREEGKPTVPLDEVRKYFGRKVERHG